jgi:hypothetical protein
VKFLTTLLAALVRPAVRFAEGWRAFWFTPADPTVLGAIRLFAGLVLLYVLALSSPLVPSLYAADGWIDLPTADILRHELPWLAPPDGWEPPEARGTESRPYARPQLSEGPDAEAYSRRWDLNPGHTIGMGQPGFSQWFHVTDPFWMKTIHNLALLVALLLSVGLATRVTSVLAWVLMLGYMHRAPASLFSLDTILALVLLYLMLGPSGAALSLDRLIERLRVALAAGAKHQPVPSMTLVPSVSANVVLRLFQVHFCIICLAAGMAKIQGAAWSSGTAVWQVLSNYEFMPPRFESHTTLLHWLTANRVLWEMIGFAGSAFTISVELGLPFLIWHSRLRWLMIIGVVVLQTAIALTMGLVALSLLMIVMVLAFVPAETVHALLERLVPKPARAWPRVFPRPRVGVEQNR